jgi:glycosyltransferase involved in cell wall biosynthesis
MRDMKASLICTIKNEESSIRDFLDSLLSQSRPPNEITIVDGGSTDDTIEIIGSYIKNGAPIKLIVREGANYAEGRNTAIKNSRYDIIASVDAGCTINKDWLKNLVKPFESNSGTKVVSGWYEPDAKTFFEKCVAELTYPKLEKVLKNPSDFLPSSRSIAYEREAWEKVGGYPEWLYTAEDTLFDLNLRKAGFKFVFAPDAIVYWKARSSMRAVFKQCYLYSRGNGHARLFFKNSLLIYALYLLGFVLLLCGFVYSSVWILLSVCILVYFLRPTMSVYRKLRSIKVFLVAPAIILANDLGNMLGCIVGSIQGVKKRRTRRNEVGMRGDA